MKATTIRTTAAAILGIALLAGVAEVAAKAVVDAYSGRFFVLKKKPPDYFQSQEIFQSFLKKYSTKTVSEDASRQWSFETMAFFKQPLSDYEVQIAFFEIADDKSLRNRRYVTAYTQYTQDRQTRILFGKTTLIRPEFDANKHYLMVARSRDKDLAEGDFKTLGTTQQAIDQQKRIEAEQKAMERSMQELEQKAREQQEQRQKQESEKAASNLF